MITDGLMVVAQQCVRERGVAAAVAPRDLAGAIARTALSHYMFPDPDPSTARREIRAAAGLPVRKEKAG